MKRLALEGDELYAGLYSLAEHVRGGRVTQGRVAAIQTLYSSIPDGVKYTGNIWRGLKVKEANVTELFENRQFVGRDRSGDSLADYWTQDMNVALNYARYASQIGIVLQSHTSEKEVYFNINDKMVKYLRTVNANAKLMDTIEGYLYEQEVVVQHSGSEAYTLCQDVKYVAVKETEVFEVNQMNQYKYPFSNLIWDSMDTESKRSYNQDTDSGQYFDVRFYQCDKQGKLHRLPPVEDKKQLLL